MWHIPTFIGIMLGDRKESKLCICKMCGKEYFSKYENEDYCEECLNAFADLIGFKLD